MPLLSEPRVPNWLPPIQASLRLDSLPESWKVYLSGMMDEGFGDLPDDLEDLTG
jgi:hypothetical protein